jgi:hypothetical protein
MTDQNAETNAVDSRIAAVISRRVGASSTEQFPITRTEGTEPVRNRMPKGSVDASVKFSTVVEPERAKIIRPADQLSQDAAPLAADAIVKVSDRVTIAPSTISGWEARLTRGWTAYDVTLDGKPVKGDQVLEALYNSLREIQSAPKGKAK